MPDFQPIARGVDRIGHVSSVVLPAAGATYVGYHGLKDLSKSVAYAQTHGSPSFASSYMADKHMSWGGGELLFAAVFGAIAAYNYFSRR